MIYGIDFGTTYTVVSYYNHDGEVQFINFDGSELLPTQKSGVENLKRRILEQSKTEAFLIESGLLKTLIDFFIYIREKIQKQTEEKCEYYNCVITVPVKFKDLNRYFIKFAAIKAGFNIIKLIQEPVAAAIAVINQSCAKDGKYIVYDLGGGTFDATLIKKDEDVWHVIRVDGLSDFGGIDIDRYIAEKCFLSLEEAEAKKKHEYLMWLDPVLEPTYRMLDKLAENEDIKGLILNGGGSYLRNVEKKYENRFTLFKGLDLQTQVSRGAAWFGKCHLNNSQFLIDVTPFNLGIEVLGDTLEVIIEENSPIPVRKKERFVPVNNKVAINILQGSSRVASECNSIGKIILETKSPFEVDFILDCDGILTVQVLDRILVLSDVFKI